MWGNGIRRDDVQTEVDQLRAVRLGIEERRRLERHLAVVFRRLHPSHVIVRDQGGPNSTSGYHYYTDLVYCSLLSGSCSSSTALFYSAALVTTTTLQAAHLVPLEPILCGRRLEMVQQEWSRPQTISPA